MHSELSVQPAANQILFCPITLSSCYLACHWQVLNNLPVPLSSPSIFSLAACRRHVFPCLPHSLCFGTLRCRTGLWIFRLYLSLNRTSRTHCATNDSLCFGTLRCRTGVSHIQSVTRFCSLKPSESFREGVPYQHIMFIYFICIAHANCTRYTAS